MEDVSEAGLLAVTGGCSRERPKAAWGRVPSSRQVTASKHSVPEGAEATIVTNKSLKCLLVT